MRAGRLAGVAACGHAGAFAHGVALKPVGVQRRASGSMRVRGSLPELAGYAGSDTGTPPATANRTCGSGRWPEGDWRWQANERARALFAQQAIERGPLSAGLPASVSSLRGIADP